MVVKGVAICKYQTDANENEIATSSKFLQVLKREQWRQTKGMLRGSREI